MAKTLFPESVSDVLDGGVGNLPGPPKQKLAAPIQIFSIEGSRPFDSIEAAERPGGAPCRQGLALIRLHGRPLGWVQLDLSAGPMAEAALAELVWNELGEKIPGPPYEPAEAETFPFFTVVVPTRNRAETLARCLESLVALEYPDFEILVVDNNPSDSSTAEVVSRLSARFPRLRYLLEETPGASNARNRGIAEARADFIAFTDDDVVVDPQWLCGLARGFAAAENVGCVAGLVMPAELETPAQLWFEQFGGFSKGYRRKVYDLDTHQDPLFPYNAAAFGTGASMAFRAETLRRFRGFDPNLGAGCPAKGGEDLDAFLRVIIGGEKIVYEPGSVAWHYHRRTYPELEAHIRGYGVGLGAFITKLLLDSKTRLDVIKRLPWAAAVLFSPRSAKNSHKAGDFPRRLAMAELAGLLAGPFAYFRARRAVRALNQRPLASLPAVAALPLPAEHSPAMSGVALTSPAQVLTTGPEGKADEPELKPEAGETDKGPPKNRGGRLRAHLRTPLFKNAYALIANTTITSLLGLPYWVLAARLYPAEQVGATSAAISTMVLIAGIALLNWEGALARFLPRAGRGSGKLILTSYAVTMGIAVAATALFFLILQKIPFLSDFVGGGWPVLAWFAVAVLSWCIFSLQDSALAGLRAATWIAIENGFFGVIKIALLVVFAGVSVKYGIFASWTVPVLLSLIPINFLIFRRLLSKHSAAHPGSGPIPKRQLRHFVAVDGLGAVFALATKNLLPIVVAARMGAKANAYFYVAWVIVTALELVSQNLGTSLTVEGSHDESKLKELSVAIGKRIVMLVVPVALGIAAFAPLVLSVFDKQYAANGTLLLRLLALAVLPRAAISLWTSIARVKGHVKGIAMAQGWIFVLVVGLSWPLMDWYGIAGIGVAYLATQLIVAAYLAPGLARLFWPRFAGAAS